MLNDYVTPETYETLKTIAANSFDNLTSIPEVTVSGNITLIEGKLPFSTVDGMKGEAVASQMFNVLFDQYAEEILLSIYDIIIDDDTPDQGDAIYSDMYEDFMADFENPEVDTFD